VSYKPVFMVDGKWVDNQQRFEKKQEALDSASSLFMRWTIPEAYDAHESDETVNYKRENHQDVMLDEEGATR